MLHPAGSNNPFKQSKELWVAEVMLPFAMLEYFTDHMGEGALSVACFETIAGSSFESRPDDIWTLQLTYDSRPDGRAFEQQLSLLAASIGAQPPGIAISQVEDQDWVTQVQEHFPPLHAGRYFVHGSHYTGEIPHACYPLQIDAGRAFGTGEHETTSACLEAISLLAKRYRFSRMLDMGCGSGILALAMAKSWKYPVVAVDIDAQAVIVTRRNARINRLSSLLHTGVSNGYRSRLVVAHVPYDLVASNILAKPLKTFAPSLARNLKAGGIAILSGLLKYQEPGVLAAHRAQGLVLVRRIEKAPWVTLVMRKGRG